MNNEAMKPGDKFTFGGYDWVCLDPEYYFGNGVLAIMAERYKTPDGKRSFKFNEDGNADYRDSPIRNTYLADLAGRIGTENLVPKEIDLVADNGDDALGSVTDYVALLSCDEFRKYRKLLPDYDDYVWTCTPWRIDDAGLAGYVRLCLTGSGGALYGSSARYSFGVAPLVVFKSSIFNPSPLGAEDAAEEEIVSDNDLQNFLFT